MNFVIVNNMKDYYIFESGRFSRKDNSIFFETTDGNIPLPINDMIVSICLVKLTLTQRL